ncbi:restriction endonuclease subunit S [Aeromonas veronii]|uniref:restriction endonuclease subunit S n=1 Tax=Aeromonas veronii TaxID=654 RepID=UPI001F187A19|nr:restriction endonuclease subunit S [Aeromonas veronii]MCF5840775.1 restriction endonuclease subunit S [Aeromonas veronii]
MNWPIVQLGALCNTVTKGTTPTSVGLSFSETGIPFIRIQDIDHNTVSVSNCLYIDVHTHNALERSKIRGGDFLITIAGTIGKVAIVPNDFPESNCNQAIAILRFDKKKLHPHFLRYWLATDKAVNQIGSKKVTATISNLSLGQIKQLQIPLPPLEEQKRIAAILDKVDAIRQKRQQALALADDFLRSVFLDMFGDPVTNPKGWDEVILKDIADIRSGVTKGKIVKDDDAITLPYMRVANVQDGYLDLSSIQEITVSQKDAKKSMLQIGDILLTEGGDPDKLGRGHVWNGEIENCIHQNHIFSVRVMDRDYVRPSFLSSVISSPRGKKYFLKVGKQTTGIATINKTVLSEFLPFIPPLEMQDKYLRIMKKVKEMPMYSECDYMKLFSSLSQKAFSGQL